MFKTLDLTDLVQFKMTGEEGGPGGFSGYAAVFGNLDRDNERIMAGAFKNLAAFVGEGFCAVGHNWSILPVATISAARQDAVGLLVECAFHSTDEAQACRTMIAERLARGKTVGMSIGFRVLDSVNAPEGRQLLAIELYEVSIVTVPANPAAHVLGVKGLSPADMTLLAHTETALAVVEEYQTRMAGLSALRVKEGRVLSAANCDRLQAMHDSLQGVCSDLMGLLALHRPDPEDEDEIEEDAAPPAEEKASADEIQAAMQRYVATLTRLS